VGDVDGDPLLPLGELGAFDDRGTTHSCVVEAGGRLHLYYTGWSLGRTVPFYFFTGLATSDDDGASFARVSRAPVLERDAVDPFLTASPAVLVDDGRWRMWYVSGTEWIETGDGPRHRYHIRHAESDDGVGWRRDGRVAIDFAGEDEYALSRPCVIRDADGRYRMWFSHRGDVYRLGYAESDDGLEWERRDADAGLDVSPSGWDSEGVAYPWVFDAGEQRFMLYNGNGYGATGIGYAVWDPSSA
jgi:hypothetical protein